MDVAFVELLRYSKEVGIELLDFPSLHGMGRLLKSIGGAPIFGIDGSVYRPQGFFGILGGSKLEVEEYRLNTCKPESILSKSVSLLEK